MERARHGLLGMGLLALKRNDVFEFEYSPPASCVQDGKHHMSGSTRRDRGACIELPQVASYVVRLLRSRQ